MDHILEAECDAADEATVEGEGVKVNQLIRTSAASEQKFSLRCFGNAFVGCSKDFLKLTVITPTLIIFAFTVSVSV